MFKKPDFSEKSGFSELQEERLFFRSKFKSGIAGFSPLSLTHSQVLRILKIYEIFFRVKNCRSGQACCLPCAGKDFHSSGFFAVKFSILHYQEDFYDRPEKHVQGKSGPSDSGV